MGKILRGRKDTLAPWFNIAGASDPAVPTPLAPAREAAFADSGTGNVKKIRETRTFNAAEKESEVTQTDMTRLTSYSFFTPARQTRPRQDCFVASGVAV